ncbi:protein-disulfide reductase DsbD domain-containing protein [Microvirga sp. 2MCAF38]|uniref:protein-disulfide reductase DsbD domain-containing protein n=1 Tax=Microvirga sp. 2MCAF38 TaxID=3232989 RepID=UPI003F98F830
MANVRHVAITTLFLLFGTLAAHAESASPWAQGLHSRARLLSGGAENGRLLAGIEIELDQGFKTYWRTPGDSGLPPRFDWTGSQNVSDIQIRWPAPSRVADAGGVSYVYGRRVVLPILLKTPEPGKPAHVNLSLEYGVCKDICIPARAELTLDLKEVGPSAAISEALALVPRARRAGAPDTLAVLSVTPIKADKPSFLVEVRAPVDARPLLFAEGPEDWYLSAAAADAPNRFVVTVEDRPKTAPPMQPFLFTVTAGDEAIETEWRLDASAQLP